MSNPIGMDTVTTLSKRLLRDDVYHDVTAHGALIFGMSNTPERIAEREATRAAFDARVAAGEVPVYLDQGSDYEDGPNGPAQWALATHPSQVKGWVSVEAWATYESELHRLEQLGDRLREQLVT